MGRHRQTKPFTEAVLGAVQSVFCIILIVLFFPSEAYAATQVELLKDEFYCTRVRELIDRAEKSVRVMMFEAAYYDRHPDSPSNILLRSLIRAKKRGVVVEVLLDNSDKHQRAAQRNRHSARILGREGVDVYLDSVYKTTHTKMLVIDGTILILGSTNWTFSALTKNHELSAVIHCKESAATAENYFIGVKQKSIKLESFD